MAEAVRQYLDDPRNQETVARLRAHGLRFEEAAREDAAGPLDGRTFVLTGRLESLTRGEAQARIEALGGQAGSTVGKGTDYVVVGEDAGSKLAKARKLGITMLDEQAFVALLGEADPEAPRLPLGDADDGAGIGQNELKTHQSAPPSARQKHCTLHIG